MKKSRFTEEQIIGFLKQAEASMPIKELCRKPFTPGSNNTRLMQASAFFAQAELYRRLK